MKKRKAISLFIIVVLCINLFAGCSKKTANENPTEKPSTEATEKPKGEPSVIRIGTRYQRSIDPFYRDPKTGETNMTPEAMRVALESVDKVKEELNVDLKWVPYTGNPDEILLTAVLANDPVCELADEANRKAIGQNILQYLDEYKYLFDSPDYSWMFPAKVYGHHLLLNKTDSIFEHSLVYNINYIEKVDALKNNGKIELPSDMWEDGKWTWSSFEDYLLKIQAYYSDKKAPVRQENSIHPYFTDLRIAAVSAINANGQAVFGQNGFGADTKEAKDAVSYVDNLYLKKLIGYNSSTNVILEKFQLGECVFADLGHWQLAKGGGKLAERGEAMGIVPFPKPDNSTSK